MQVALAETVATKARTARSKAGGTNAGASSAGGRTQGGRSQGGASAQHSGQRRAPLAALGCHFHCLFALLGGSRLRPSYMPLWLGLATPYPALFRPYQNR